MNWFPTIPTDSLHKYIALNGLLFIYAIIALLVLLNYQNFEHEQFNKKLSILTSNQEAIKKYKARIQSINQGKYSENYIADISNQFKPKEELIFLKNAIPIQERGMESLIEDTKKQPKNYFPLLTYFHIEILLVAFMIIGVILSYVGFRNWYIIQRVSDESQKYDRDIKSLQLIELKRNKIKRHT